MKLCKYKNILGFPGKGIHFHLFGIAIMDVIFTFIGAWIIKKILNYFNIFTQYWVILLLLFMLGILLHKIFCIKTTINKLLYSIL